MKEEAKAKRKPVTIRLTDETIHLARELTKIYKDDEKKLGEFIEDTILHYASTREDESRTNALLKTTEDRLFNKFEEQVNAMYRAFKKRDNNLVERITSLIAIQSFETTLTELMIKDLYIKDEYRKQQYENLRSISARKMKDRYIKSDLSKINEMQNKIIEMEREKEEIEKKFVSNIIKLKEKINDLQEALKAELEINKKAKLNIDTLKNYIENLNKLISWYEIRDKRVPELQEKNKTVLGKQSYEKAITTFEELNKKPERPQEPILNGIWW